MNGKEKGIIISGILLVLVVGISFAYFLTTVNLNGDLGNAVDVQTVVLEDGSKITVDGTLSFDDKDILPGHKNVSAIKVTAIGGKTTFYNLIWTGTNTLNTPLNYTVYKTTTEEYPAITCTKKKENRMYYEVCTNTGFDNLGTPIATGTIPKTATPTKYVLKGDQDITGDNTVYYYVVLEYPNLDEVQNIDVNGAFDGITTIEVLKSNFAPKLSLISKSSTADTVTVNVDSEDAVSYYYKIGNKEYVNSTDKTYTFTGLDANTEYEFMVYAVNNVGDSSVVIKDRIKTKNVIVANNTVVECPTSFTGASASDESKLCSGAKDQDGDTYYFRGNVTNNWVKFGKDGDSDIYWRIIRVNGDGSLRMIYNGTSTTTTGTGTQLGTKAFNTSNNSAEYVGLQYTLGEQRGTGTSSTILGATDSTDATTLYGWYNTKIKGTNYEKYVDTNAVFCSDRDTVTNYFSGYTGTGTGTANTAFAPAKRAYTSSWSWNTTQAPVMTCATNNQLRLPVGLITYDEAVYAGGFGGTNNTSYYLYTGQNYWTMSPYFFNGSYAYVFRVNSNGLLGSNSVSNANGVRPVINLKADTKLTNSGTGTVGSSTNPYEVVLTP